MTTAVSMEQDEPENDTMMPSTDQNVNERENQESETIPQQESNGDDRRHLAETPMMHLPELSSSRPRERSSGAYSFVNESGVLHPVSGESCDEQEYSLLSATTTPAHDTTTTNTNEDLAPTQAAAAMALETETDTVMASAVENNDGGGQSTTMVSAATLTDDFTETATVVATVDECSDDAIIRKILQEDLIASGRSTDELQEYIRTASLENVASRMSRATEEEKTEIQEPDSALAWALHEHELLSSATNVLLGENNSPAVAAAVATVEEEATVVGITENDVHPAELESSDARAELIGQDYSVNYVDTRDTIDAPTPAAAFAAMETTEEEATAEATVLDSKPAAVPSPWSEKTAAEEATVLETKPPADESWRSRADDEAGEVRVDAVVEEEASVVHITEDAHPAEFEENDVQATFIGRDYTSTVAVGDGAVAGEEAVVVDITEDVHPADFEQNEAEATLIGSTRAVSYSTPPTQRPHTAARAVSDPPRNPVASPVDLHTSGSFNAGIEALDAMEQQTWMNRPPPWFVEGDQVVPLMPPPPPAASAPMAAALVVDDGADSDNCSEVPPLPPRATVNGGEPPRTSSARTEESERSSGTSGSGRLAAASLQMLSTAAVRGTNSMMRSTGNLMDVLFGETRQTQHGFDLDAAAGSILPRTLLPWSVFPKPNGMWVATVNTNQKALDSNNVREASKALRAFSCATQTQAEALARAWAPPRMLPFSDNPTCFICESKFAVFKRACHCRNCGVTVCGNCVVQWPSKMLPETYNIKRENLMNVCKSCDWLCSTLRLALLNGQHDQAIAVHATGNVNLVTPFANVKGELFYPVHCAVLGGSLSLLKWLVDDHCCPLRSLRVGGRRQSRGSYTPILTSRGRSLLGIAMENRNLEIIRYLVADKNMSLADEKGLSMETTIATLEAALRRLPAESDGTIPEITETTTVDSIEFIPTPVPAQEMSMPSSSHVSFAVQTQISPTSTSGSGQGATSRDVRISGAADDASSGSVEDACIICYANTIDCVATPCGHQICCMQCSTHISRCPVCSVDCSFMRVFKP